MGWRMYERRASEVCDVRFFERDAAGALAPIALPEQPGQRRAFRVPEQADFEARKLCVDDRDVRLRVRCGHWYRGWDTKRDETQPVCTVVP